jgi:hypothetical protein
MLQQEGVSKAVSRAHVGSVAVRAAATALLLQPLEQLGLLAGWQLRVHVLRCCMQRVLVLRLLLCG